ncbi:unnamed protein product, partial [Mycena citricolor]
MRVLVSENALTIELGPAGRIPIGRAAHHRRSADSLLVLIFLRFSGGVVCFSGPHSGAISSDYAMTAALSINSPNITATASSFRHPVVHHFNFLSTIDKIPLQSNTALFH